MSTQFRFKGFEPTEQFINQAEGILERIESIAPEDSTVLALIEFDGKEYGCSFDVFLDHGSVYDSVAHRDPLKAILLASVAIEEKLGLNQGLRFIRPLARSTVSTGYSQSGR